MIDGSLTNKGRQMTRAVIVSEVPFHIPKLVKSLPFYIPEA